MEAWAPSVASTLKDRLAAAEAQLSELERELDQLERESTAACAALRAALRAHEAAAARRERQGRQQQQPQAGASAAPASEAAREPPPQDGAAAALARACGARRRCAPLLHPRHVALARAHELIVTLGSALLAAASAMPPPAPAKPRKAPAGGAELAAVAVASPAPDASGEQSKPQAGDGAPDRGAGWLPRGLDLSWRHDEGSVLVSEQPPVGGSGAPAAALSGGPGLPADSGGADPVDVALLLLQACLELRKTQARLRALRTTCPPHPSAERGPKRSASPCSPWLRRSCTLGRATTTPAGPWGTSTCVQPAPQA